MEKIDMNEIPSKESIPSILRFVVMAMRIFFNTSIFCIIRLNKRSENHSIL